ncbi:MAG TPA: substrate-binding domain-containing protein [Actinocrinis sp.]|nr:substrate-binding domain-containing protein [Actinocrinis sp.]
MHVPRFLAVAGAAALAVTALGMSSAQADPASTPAVTSLVAVGSDTIQFVADSFATAYNATTPAPANPFASYDATGTTPIETKNDTNCTNIARPNGSGAGINQLAAWIGTSAKVPTKTYGYACVDMARASRNLTASDPNWLTSVLFAHDLITYATNTGGNGTTTAVTDTELTAIYECNASLIPHTPAYPDAPVTWSEVGGTSTDAISPVLPQAGSGTRSQWLTDIGVTTPGSCVVNGTFGGSSIEENEGTNAVFTSAGNPTGWKDVLFPYSGGVYVCQVYTSNCGTINTAEGSLVLRNIDSKAPLTTATPPVINVTGLSAFPAKYIRGLYFVVRNGGSQSAPKVATPTTTGSQWPVDMTPFLGQGNTSGWICGTAAATIIKNYGFATVTNCGSLLNSTATPSPAPVTP